MPTLRQLVRALRPLAHANIAPPLLFGQALAMSLGASFSWRGFALAQAFGLADHAFIVLANDLRDRETDRANTTFNLFSGGSRAWLDEGTPVFLTRATYAAALAVLAISLAGLFTSPWFPVLGGAALAIMIAYSWKPLELSYRGGGAILQGLGVGVVLPLVGVAAQGHELDASVLPYLAPTFLLGVASNWLTSLPDEPSDRASEKHTLAADYGGTVARRATLLLTGAAIAYGCHVLTLDPKVRGVVLAGSALALTIAAAFTPRAEPTARSALLTFMIAVGAASTLAWLGWTFGLVLTARGVSWG